ncbi:helix-turn-helix transcriptional regulator [Bowmanella denitrificans]|uniref:helix-turn-helix transcriptional regulator n=1 Tax=Bowmanella denitrificans TaxID=366582 RepID=UPI000C9BADD4|nr:response regulator transcription factor [Bowmanella denitrificans]
MDINTCSVLIVHIGEAAHQSQEADIFLRLLKTRPARIQEVDCPSKIHNPSQFDLLFFNIQGAYWGEMLPGYLLDLAVEHRIALFNASQDSICETLVLLAGIDGVFYRQDPPDLILKGIGHLLDKQRWFRRDAMDRALQTLLKCAPVAGQNRQKQDEEFDALTKREMTIVRMLSSGAQNKEIANQLHISTNTVKTHLYSVFRKTHCRNRLELLSWVQQHLPMQMVM